MIDLDDYDAILSALYSSVADAGQLRDVARRLAKLLPGGSGVTIRRVNKFDFSQPSMIIEGLDPEYIHSFETYWGERNIFKDLVVSLKPLEIASAPTHMDLSYIEKTEFYHEFMKPQDLSPASSRGVIIGGDSTFNIVLTLDVAGPVSDQLHLGTIDLLRRLTPHLVRVLNLATDAWTEGLKTSLATIPTAALILSRERKVMHLNAAAQNLLPETSLFVDRAGILRGRTPYADSIVETVAGQVARRVLPVQTVKLSDFGPLGHLYLTVAPVQHENVADLLINRHAEAAAILYIATDHTRMRTVLPRLMSVFGLTREEAVVAYGIHSGTPMERVAVVAGLSLYETMLIVERVKERLDARRYADVVRKVGRLTGSV